MPLGRYWLTKGSNPYATASIWEPFVRPPRLSTDASSPGHGRGTAPGRRRMFRRVVLVCSSSPERLSPLYASRVADQHLQVRLRLPHRQWRVEDCCGQPWIGRRDQLDGRLSGWEHRPDTLRCPSLPDRRDLPGHRQPKRHLQQRQAPVDDARHTQADLRRRRRLPRPDTSLPGTCPSPRSPASQPPHRLWLPSDALARRQGDRDHQRQARDRAARLLHLLRPRNPHDHSRPQLPPASTPKLTSTMPRTALVGFRTPGWSVLPPVDRQKDRVTPHRRR
jgi:hypothetical protein